MAGKPARMGGASGYIMWAFAKATQISSPSATTTRSSLFETQSLRRWTSNRSGSRALCARLTRRFSAAGFPATIRRLPLKREHFAALLQMPRRFCHSCTPLKQRSPRWNVTTVRIWVSPLWARGSLSFQRATHPLHPPALSSQGPASEKAAGQSISAAGDEWAFAGCKPAHLTLSPQRDFSHSLHLPWPESLCSCEQSGLVRWEQWWQVGLQLVIGGFRSCRARTNRFSAAGPTSCMPKWWVFWKKEPWRRFPQLRASQASTVTSSSPRRMVGSAQLALTESSARAGQTEPGSRHAISEQCPLRRVDALPTNGSGNMGIFGRPELFASEDNTHCQINFSKDSDALAHDWPNLLLYAFPLIALIPQVIRRIREQKHRVLLVAPLWRNQHWFSELARLTAALWPIPLRQNLLSLRWTEWFGTPTPIYGHYIFGLSMGAFSPPWECAKYYFLG